MKKIAIFLLVCVILMATGCPKKLYETRPSTKFQQNDLTNQINSYLQNRQMAYYCALSGHHVNYNFTALEYSCGQQGNPNALTDAKRIRDEAIERAVGVVDSVYGDFIDDLNTGRATTNFIADVIDLGVGAAVGITKGERALQILGVALTAFRGGRKSIDINFFREQTVPILIAKMDDNRAKVYGSILQKKTMNVNDYQMEEAIRDIVSYFNAGTLIRAFTELAKETGSKAKANEEKLLRLKGVKTLDEIPTVEEVDVARLIFNQLKEIDAQLDTTALATAQEAGKKRIELIYGLINKDDTFKTVSETLKTKGDQSTYKPIFDKITAKQPLTPRETFDFVYGIFEYTEGNVELTKKLGDIFATTKPK